MNYDGIKLLQFDELRNQLGVEYDGIELFKLYDWNIDLYAALRDLKADDNEHKISSLVYSLLDFLDKNEYDAIILPLSFSSAFIFLFAQEIKGTGVKVIFHSYEIINNHKWIIKN